MSLGGFTIEIKTKIRYVIIMITAYYEITYFGLNFHRKTTLYLLYDYLTYSPLGSRLTKLKDSAHQVNLPTL